MLSQWKPWWNQTLGPSLPWFLGVALFGRIRELIIARFDVRAVRAAQLSAVTVGVVR